MHEAVAQRAGVVAREQPVAGKPLRALLQRAPHVFRGVVFVVQMDFRFAAGAGAHVGDALHDVGIVLLDRVEKGVFRRHAVGIAEFVSEPWPFPLPGLHAGQRLRFAHAVKRLEMVADRQHHVPRAERVLGVLLSPLPGGQPDIQRPDHGSGNECGCSARMVVRGNCLENCRN